MKVGATDVCSGKRVCDDSSQAIHVIETLLGRFGGRVRNAEEDFRMRREQTLADRITGSALWRSVVRHGYPDTQRNQALIIASNVFLHIHPVKIKRYATKVTYTFCLGGLSFFMFLVLVMTGVLLMFYYVPSADRRTSQ